MILESVTDETIAILLVASELGLPVTLKTEVIIVDTYSSTVVYKILKPPAIDAEFSAASTPQYQIVDTEIIEMRKVKGAGNIEAMGYGPKTNKLIIRKHDHSVPIYYGQYHGLTITSTTPTREGEDVEIVFA